MSVENKGGIKFDTGKVRLELIPPELLFAVGEILTFGANKYTSNEWSEFWNYVGAKRVSVFIPKENVVHVTKNNSGKLTLSSQIVNVKTGGIGKEEILIESWSWLDVEKKIPLVENGMLKPSAEEILRNTEFPLINIMNTFEEAVKFAALQNTFTLITTILQENTEVYCVVSTTTVWASLVITLKGLKPHLDISVLKPKTGDRNWENGMKWSRVFGALMRHMWAWWGGKGPTTKNFVFGELDVETGKSHLWHAGCCIAFLIAYEERGVGEDDRATKE